MFICSFYVRLFEKDFLLIDLDAESGYIKCSFLHLKGYLDHNEISLQTHDIFKSFIKTVWNGQGLLKWGQDLEGYLKIQFINSKIMSHTYDVIKIHINEGTQKLKTHCQSKLGVQNRFSDIFPSE